jgi:uncharacterized caspase-like protein
MGEVLKKLNFDIAEGNMLVGEAKWEKVRDTIRHFFHNVDSSDDMLLFYYSGHGAFDDDGELYLALSDINLDDP